MQTDRVTDGAKLRTRDVREIIRLAKLNNKAQQAIYEKHGLGSVLDMGDPGVRAALEEADNIPEEAALRKRVGALGRKERVELIALMWLGRGEGGEEAGDWKNLVAHAETLNRDGDVPYICEKSPLPEYLDSGLKALNTRD